MKRKRWGRILRRLAHTKHPATAIRQWAGGPARAQRSRRRYAAATRFARRQADGLPQTSTRARYWRRRAGEWSAIVDRLDAKIEADLGQRRIIPRKAWDSTPDDRASARMSTDAEGLFAHHSVSGSPTTPEGERAEMRTLDAIARGRGFVDISYSFVIFPSGRIYEGRGKGVEGAHTLGFNDTAHAAVGAGNYESAEPSAAMVASFGWLRDELGASKFRPHSEVYATSCPGRHLRGRLF